MKMKLKNIGKFPETQTIKDFEEFYRVALPDAFIHFIKNFNGGIPEKFIVTSNNEERLVEKFLCILDNRKEDSIQGQYDIDVVITQIEDRLIGDEDLIGADIIPFASVFGGDFLCIDFREAPDHPSIVLWDHNESDELSPVTYLVNESADSFFKALL